MADEVTTFTMTLAGRDIGFKRPTLGQVIMLQRMATRARTAAEKADADNRVDHMTTIMIKTLDFIETLILAPEDRDFVEEQMVAGNIDYPDLLKALSGGDGEQAADDEAPKPKRAASKKAARTPAKAAPRARTKR